MRVYLPRISRCLSALILGLLTQAACAEWYQCTDASGRTVFKDKPCAAGETLVKQLQRGAFEPRLEKLTPLGTNLLLNPDFEEKLVDWHIPKGVLWSSDSGTNISGALVMRANRPPKDRHVHETTAAQCVPLQAGGKYQLVARIKLDRIPARAYANRVSVTWHETPDCSGSGQWGASIEPASIRGWQTLANNHLTPLPGAMAAKITIVQRARYTNGGKAVWDDLIFGPTEIVEQSVAVDVPGPISTRGARANQIINGGFDHGLDAWHSDWPSEWADDDGHIKTGAARVLASSGGGSKGRLALSQCIDIGTNRRFELGASFKNTPGSDQIGNARVQLTWHDEAHCRGRSKLGRWADPRIGPDWQRLIVSKLVAPGRMRSATLEIIQNIRGAGHYAVLWDDIYLRPID